MNDNQEIKIGTTDDDRNELKPSCRVEFDNTPQQVESLAVEWKNGDECIYRGGWAIVVGWHPQHPLVVIDTNYGFEAVRVGDLSKPETPQQREERERIEAAIMLHDIANLAYYEGCLPFNCSWSHAGEKVKSMWLAVVDKTGYRINKDGE